MSDYPRILVDNSHAPYRGVSQRIVDAINYAATYEDRGLDWADGDSALHDVLAFWDSWQEDYWAVYKVAGFDAANQLDIEGDAERVDRIADILSNHGYSLYE